MTLPGPVLVTGGGGFLGGAIVRRLVAEKMRVASFSRSRHAWLERAGVRQIHGDLANPDDVQRAVKGCKTVFHVAARAGVWGPYASYYNTNVIGTRNVIEACRRQRVAALVHTSSPSVVFDGRDMEGIDESAPYPDRYHAPYPETKALAEQAVKDAGGVDLATIILRPHLIWGPRDNHLVPRILARARRLARVGHGRNLVDTIYIDNAADAHLLAAERLHQSPSLSGRVYFISQDDPLPLWQMVDRILTAGGKPPVKRQISKRTAVVIGTLLETLFRWLHLKQEPPMTRFVAEELATSHWFNIEASKKDLGYHPRVSTDEGLYRLARWLEKHPLS